MVLIDLNFKVKIMDLVKIFRWLLVINFMAFISYLFVDYGSLIQSNSNLTEPTQESYISVIDNVNPYVGLIFVSIALLTTPLLFFFVKWSRELYIGVLAVVLLVTVMDAVNGSYVLVSELEKLVIGIENATVGAILALAYLTSVKDKFN